MPSSISNSEHCDTALRSAVIALLAGAVLLAAAVEIGTRSFIYGMSGSLARIHGELTAASQIRRTDPTHRQVLLVGNSLLLADVDVAEMNGHLRPEWTAVRFAIEQTTYYDWYYGLLRLLAEGARPDVVVLCLEPRHIIQPSVRSEIFAHYLMQQRDLPSVSRTLQLNLSDTADLFLANVSAFYALRKEIRKNLLVRLMPKLPNLTTMITRSTAPPPSLAALQTVAKERLLAMRDSAASSNVRLMLLVPPPLQPDHSHAWQELGKAIAVPVLTPMHNDQLRTSDYEADGYHLNETGRTRFTRKMVPLLKQALKEQLQSS